MVPGIPTPAPSAPAPATSPSKKPASPTLTPPAAAAAAPPPAAPAPTLLASLADTWDEVRDAVVETDLAVAASAHLSRAARAAAVVWHFSRNAAWILGTSALVLVVPLLYEIDKEIPPDGQLALDGSAAPPAAAAPADTAPTAALVQDAAPAAASS